MRHTTSASSRGSLMSRHTHRVAGCCERGMGPAKGVSSDGFQSGKAKKKEGGVGPWPGEGPASRETIARAGDAYCCTQNGPWPTRAACVCSYRSEGTSVRASTAVGECCCPRDTSGLSLVGKSRWLGMLSARFVLVIFLCRDSSGGSTEGHAPVPRHEQSITGPTEAAVSRMTARVGWTEGTSIRACCEHSRPTNPCRAKCMQRPPFGRDEGAGSRVGIEGWGVGGGGRGREA